MAASDAKPVPVKNAAYRITFPIYDADGDLVTGATGLDSEVSKDGGTFADCTNEATEIATSSGVYYLDLTSTEMNADTVAIIVKTSSGGAKTTIVVLNPQEAGDIKVDVETISDDATAASNAEAFFDGTGYAGTGNVIPTVTTLTNAPSDSSGTTTLLSRVTSTRAGYWDNLSGGAVMLAASYSAPPSASTIASQVRTELTTELGRIDVAISTRLASASYTAPLDAAGVRSAVGLATANLDTQLGDIPTVAEFEARTLVAANYGTQANQLTIIGYIDAEIGSIISSLSTIDGKLGTIIDLGGGATIGANLNHLNSVIDTIYTVVDSLGLNGSSMSSIPWNAAWDAEVQSECADALTAYDPPTNAEMEARTLLAATYATASVLDTVAANVVLVLADTGTDGVVLSADTCNKIADHVRRRTQANIEASSDGDTLSLLSLYGVVQQIQESNAVGTTLTVYRTDGTTSLGTRTLATDPAADPVTGVS